MKAQQYWSYAEISKVELPQEKFDAVKLKGRFLEDAENLFELINFYKHPCFNLPSGKEHLEPNALNFTSYRLDLCSTKILLTLLQNSKVSNVRLSCNLFDIDVLSYLIGGLLKRKHPVTSIIY